MPADSSSPGPPGAPGMPSRMRASDADRDRVIAVLQDAVGDGRLTHQEFDERMAAGLAARTLGDLATLTDDLIPPAPSVPPSPPAPVPAPGWPDRPMAPSRDGRRGRASHIDQRGGSIRRTGPWEVPSWLRIRARWCDVLLDFRSAVLSSESLLLELRLRGGSLTLVGGPGLLVDTHGIDSRYTDIDLGPSPDPAGSPRFTVYLSGRSRYTVVEVRRS